MDRFSRSPISSYVLNVHKTKAGAVHYTLKILYKLNSSAERDIAISRQTFLPF